MAKITKKSHASKNVQAERASRRATIESEIKAMASKANARLRALERNNLTSASNAYRYIERRHFDKDTAIATDKSGRIKFDTALKKKTASQLQHEKRELERFLYEAKTSSVRGTNAKYTKAFTTFKERHPELKNVSRQTFDAVARSEGFRAYVRAFGSSQIAPLMKDVSDALSKNSDAMAAVRAALAKIDDNTTLDEFRKQALPPSQWLENSAEDDDLYLPDSSAWGSDDEDLDGFIPIDQFLHLPKRSGTGKRGGRRK